MLKGTGNFMNLLPNSAPALNVVSPTGFEPVLLPWKGVLGLLSGSEFT